MNTGNRRSRTRAGRAAIVAIGAVAGLALLLVYVRAPRRVEACGGTPPATCGLSVALTKSVPAVIVVPPGPVIVSIPTTVFMGLVESPPGSGACPPPPYMCTVSLGLACVPPPGASGMVTVPILPGANAIAVPVTIPAGPPRACVVTGLATVTLSNGQIASAAGDATLCIVRASPNDPSVPEVDIQVLGSETQRVHPGDMASFKIRICNNHPSQKVTLAVTGDSHNTSRLPTEVAPGPAGTNLYAFSDPGHNTDAFDIQWGELVDGCVPMRPAPHLPFVPTVTQELEIAPGECGVTMLAVRPNNMCADGSCNESAIVFSYTREDGETGIACVSVAAIADTTVPARYECPDSGAVTSMTPKPGGGLSHQGRPNPVDEWLMETQIELLQITANGLPVNAVAQQSSHLLTNTMRPTSDYARSQMLAFNPGGAPLFSAGAFFDIFYLMGVDPDPLGPPVTSMITGWSGVPGAPAGFETRAPFTMGTLLIEAPPLLDSFFDVFHQVSLDGLDVGGARIPIEIISLSLVSVTPNTVTIQLHCQASVTTGPPIAALAMYNDLRGYARPDGGPAVGACCDGDLGCIRRTGAGCSALGGVYQGDGTVCDGDPCGVELDPVEPADANCDGFVDSFDIAAFVLCLTNPPLYASTYPDCDISNCDLDVNGTVDAFDIGPFIGCLTGNCAKFCEWKVVMQARHPGCGVGACPLEAVGSIVKGAPMCDLDSDCPPAGAPRYSPFVPCGGGVCKNVYNSRGTCDP